MYDWSKPWQFRLGARFGVSVVVERMYDWSRIPCISREARWGSVVVERMYDWSTSPPKYGIIEPTVSVVVERMYDWSMNIRCQFLSDVRFSCCWKDVRLKPKRHDYFTSALPVSVVVERMYDWSHHRETGVEVVFRVSVVVERMYDWSSETNWLKTNDFWQLVSDLFFENGRSAQKVPLFSKIWGDLGDCLTVFDSCSNI